MERTIVAGGARTWSPRPSSNWQDQDAIRQRLGPKRPSIPVPQPLKHPRYPVLSKEKKRMTIALGVLCSGGVVLGVDTQHSLGDGQFTEQKMFTFPRGQHYQVIAAGFGNSDSIRLAVEGIEIALDGTASTVREVRRQISSALKALYTEHIDPCPPDERHEFDFSLLVAIHLGHATRLFRTNRTMVCEVKGLWVMGVGEQFARYALAALLGNCPSAEVASRVAAYIIGMTKESVQGVGFATDIHILQNDGRHWGLLLPEVKALEENFGKLIRAFQDVIATIDSLTVPDVERIRERLLRMEAPILTMRIAQADRLTRRDKTDALIQEYQLALESTKHDPKSPLPSQG